MRSMAATAAMQMVLLSVLLLLWQSASGYLVDELLISKPTAIWQRFLTMMETGELPSAMVATLGVVVAGLFWGTIAGVAIGALVALCPPMRTILAPFIEILFAVPKIALVPLFILWFGLGYGQRTIFTATVIFFFIFFATWNGIRHVPATLRTGLQILGASTMQQIRVLYLPASFGWILGGLRIATPYAFVAAVSAEVIASREGLGALVKTSSVMLDTAGMFVGIVTATLAAAVSGGLVNFVDGLWQRKL